MRARSAWLVAVILTVGLVGCSGSNDHDKTAADGGAAAGLDGMAPVKIGGGDLGAPKTTTCKTSSDCAKDTICLPSGKCVPDCRVSKQCPQQAPVCDETSGMCGGGGDGGSSKPPATDGITLTSCKQASDCGKDKVCTDFGVCVPDCRIVKESCPAAHPVCDTTTGVCGGNAVDGGAATPPPCKQSSDCQKDYICATGVNFCVPDCRVSKQCPSQAPTCDTSNGLCK